MCTDGHFSRGAGRRQAGVTLVELIMAIMIVGIAMAGVLSVFVATVRNSADPMVRAQAQLIAESYLEEILLKRFYDPDTDNVCPAAEGSRGAYDNVCDYDGVADDPPKNQLGTAIGALTGYAVTVLVTRDATVTLNGLTNGAAANEIRVLRVDVTVNGPGAAKAAVTGYRTNYNCNATADPECKGP